MNVHGLFEASRSPEAEKRDLLREAFRALQSLILLTPGRNRPRWRMRWMISCAGSFQSWTSSAL